MTCCESEQLLDRLQAAGVTAEVDGGALLLRPKERIPPDLLEDLRRHKAEIIATLTDRPRPSRAEVLERLAALEPNSEAEADYIRSLQAAGWTRRELVTLLNEDTVRRYTPAREPLDEDPRHWPAGPRYLLEALVRLGLTWENAEDLARRCWAGDPARTLEEEGIEEPAELLEPWDGRCCDEQPETQRPGNGF